MRFVQCETLPPSTTVLYLMLGKEMLPPTGKGWSLFLLWACSHIAGFVASQLNLPPLLGMLLIGLALTNLPTGDCCIANLHLHLLCHRTSASCGCS